MKYESILLFSWLLIDLTAWLNTCLLDVAGCQCVKWHIWCDLCRYDRCAWDTSGSLSGCSAN